MMGHGEYCLWQPRVHSNVAFDRHMQFLLGCLKGTLLLYVTNAIMRWISVERNFSTIYADLEGPSAGLHSDGIQVTEMDMFFEFIQDKS